MGFVTVNREVHFFHGLQKVARGCLKAMINFPRGATSVHVTRCRSNSEAPGTSLAGGLTRVFKVSPRTLSIPSVSDCVNLLRALFALRSECKLAVRRARDNVSVCTSPGGKASTTRLSRVLGT